MASTHSEILSIQYLRALAAIGVLFFHRLGMMWFGEYGVDLFFVISGFVMIATTDAKAKTPAAFFIDRVIRIAPLYWLTILAGAFLITIGIGIYGYDYTLQAILSSMFFIPYENGRGEVWPVILQGWTLNLEMFFYTLFAFTLFFPGRTRLLLLGAAFVSLVAFGAVFQPQSPILKTYSSPLLLEFLAGAVLGRFFGLGGNKIDAMKAALATAAAAAFLLAASFLVDHRLAWGALAVVVIGAALGLERLGMVPYIGWLRYLGYASFSIYIFQQISFDLSKLAFTRLTEMTGINFLYIWFWRPADVAIALLSGLLVYAFVEKPISRYMKSSSRARQPAVSRT